MNPAQLQEQATRSAAQGQQMLESYRGNAADYRNQYNQYRGQADTANQNLRELQNYMAGAGSGANLYRSGIEQANRDQGFDPASLAASTQNLIRSQNAMGALQQQAQTSSGGYGLSGAQLGSFYAGASQPLANQIQAQTNAVGGLQKLYENSLGYANQYAGQELQSEQVRQANLQSVFSNAKAQADRSAELMNFYDKMASDQGGLNAQQAQFYTQALANYRQSQMLMAQSSNLMAQAGLYGQQSRQIGQQIDFMNDARNRYGVGAMMGLGGNNAQPSAPVANAAQANANKGISPSLQGRGLISGAVQTLIPGAGILAPAAGAFAPRGAATGATNLANRAGSAVSNWFRGL